MCILCACSRRGGHGVPDEHEPFRAKEPPAPHSQWERVWADEEWWVTMASIIVDISSLLESCSKTSTYVFSVSTCILSRSHFVCGVLYFKWIIVPTVYLQCVRVQQVQTPLPSRIFRLTLRVWAGANIRVKWGSWWGHYTVLCMTAYRNSKHDRDPTASNCMVIY